MTTLDGALNNEEAADTPTTEQGSRTHGSLVILLLIASYLGVLYMTYQLGFGTLMQPGPGLWPFIVAFAGVTLSIITLLKGVKWTPSESGTYKWTGVMMALVAGYGVALPILGYLLATIGFCLGTTKLLGRMSWTWSIITSLLTAALSFIVFNIGLNVPVIESSIL